MPFERVAAIYDIHGNLPALEAVLHEIQKANVDHLVVGGDVVPGPMPREMLAALQSLAIPVQFIQGNGEIAVLAASAGEDPGKMPEQAKEAVRWNAQQLSSDDLRLLASWPKSIRLDVQGFGEVFFCHATPRNDNEIFTRVTPAERLLPIFDALNAVLVVCGHTHMQFDRLIGKTRVVNAGSVGMPFGQPGADWLMLGSDAELRHTNYDLASASGRLRATTCPQVAEFVDRYVLNPPAESEMLEIFNRVAIQ